MTTAIVEFRAAKCPECGADIQVPASRDNVKCTFCGKDVVVRRAIQAAAGAQVQNWMKLAKAAEDAGNHEEAYAFYGKVLEVESGNAEAWLGRAIAAGWGSNLRHDRLGEMASGIEQAIVHADETEQEALKRRGSIAVAEVVLGYFKLSASHTREFITVDSAWPEHVERCVSMIAAMKKAISWTPADRGLLDGALAIVDSLLKGVEYPKGEFGDGYAYLNVPPSMRPDLERVRADLIARIRALDPTFVAGDVKPVSEPGCGAMLGVLVIMAILGFAVLMLVVKLSKG